MALTLKEIQEREKNKIPFHVLILKNSGRPWRKLEKLKTKQRDVKDKGVS